MPWHDGTPWRAKRKAEVVTAADRLKDVERRLRTGDLGMHEALLAAYAIGIEAGRANPAVVKVGEQHATEVQS